MAEVAADHHRCEFPFSRCEVTNTRTYEYENELGERRRSRYCNTHAQRMADRQYVETQRERLHDVWKQLPTAMTPADLAVHPAQLAMMAHQEVCAQCAAVRDYIAHERLNGTVDISQVGAYIIEHCCDEGVNLNREVGLAMVTHAG